MIVGCQIYSEVSKKQLLEVEGAVARRAPQLATVVRATVSACTVPDFVEYTFIRFVNLAYC